MTKSSLGKLSIFLFRHCKNEFVISTIQIVILVAILSYYSLSPIYMDLWIINSSTIELFTPGIAYDNMNTIVILCAVVFNE